MKITKIWKNAKWQYRVNDPYGPHGKRQRRFFGTREAAERYARQRTDDRNSFGIYFACMPASERAALAYHLQRLRRLGWSLAAAVDFIERHGKAPPSILLGTVASQFLAARQAGGLRPRYLRKLQASINRFLIGRRDKPIAEVTLPEIEEYIGRNGWKPSTMRSYLVDVRTLFAFAVKRKFLRENTALAIDLPRLEDKAPGIMTPVEARAILEACLDVAPDILSSVALQLFGGLRRSEAERIAWPEILPDYLDVKAHKAKTRRRRLVPISPQLRVWLDCSSAVRGTLPAVNYADKFKRALEKAGLREDWPQNALRHSFCSYHLAYHGNPARTAMEAGHSEAMLYAHYRELVRPAEAEAFFAILPPEDALARAKMARARCCRPTPPRHVKAAEETVAGLFEGGQKILSRKEAIAALRTTCGYSASGAYRALSPTGRFRGHLREADGFLTWLPLPLMNKEGTADAGEPAEVLLPSLAAAQHEKLSPSRLAFRASSADVGRDENAYDTRILPLARPGEGPSTWSIHHCDG